MAQNMQYYICRYYVQGLIWGERVHWDSPWLGSPYSSLIYMYVSEATRSSFRGCKFQKFQKFPGGACPPDPLVWACYCTLWSPPSDKIPAFILMCTGREVLIWISSWESNLGPSEFLSDTLTTSRIFEFSRIHAFLSPLACLISHLYQALR